MREKKIIQLNERVYVSLITLYIIVFCTLLIIVSFDSLTENTVAIWMIMLLTTVVLPIIFLAYLLGEMKFIKFFRDRIEVAYPFHRKWNFQINIKDVSSYCICVRELSNLESLCHSYNSGINRSGINRVVAYEENMIFLMRGKELLLLASDLYTMDNYLNHVNDGVQTMLTDYYNIPQREGTIELSKEEVIKARHGGTIVLDDISKEELAGLESKRIERPIPDSYYQFQSKRKWIVYYISIVMLVTLYLTIYFLFIR